jgi:CRISPR-associated endonuclease/helicase Cas3
VLEPVGDAGYQRPARWGEVYDHYLLAATQRVLTGLDGGLTIPDDVQPLMEAVYAEDPAAVPEDLRGVHQAHRFTGTSERTVAGYVQIPSAAGEIGMLSRLSEKEVEEADASTRLGADSVRIVCCYRDGTGARWLDPDRARPLPIRGSGDRGRISTTDVRRVLQQSFPVRATLVGARPPADLPSSWQDNAGLSELTLLEFRLGTSGPEPLDLAGRITYLDPALGLVSRRPATPPPS